MLLGSHLPRIESLPFAFIGSINTVEKAVLCTLIQGVKTCFPPTVTEETNPTENSMSMLWEDYEETSRFLNNNNNSSSNKTSPVAEVVLLSGFWPRSFCSRG